MGLLVGAFLSNEQAVALPPRKYPSATGTLLGRGEEWGLEMKTGDLPPGCVGLPSLHFFDDISAHPTCCSRTKMSYLGPYRDKLCELL